MYLELIPTLQNKVLKRGTNHGGLLLSFASRVLSFAQNEIASAEAGDWYASKRRRAESLNVYGRGYFGG